MEVGVIGVAVGQRVLVGVMVGVGAGVLVKVGLGVMVIVGVREGVIVSVAEGTGVGGSPSTVNLPDTFQVFPTKI